MSETYNPELYTEAQVDCLEKHVETYFGSFSNVFHEILSPDIHVDIAVIDPSPERNYYTLVTMGMGAHQMAVPTALKDDNLDRAELLITLPPDWELKNEDERCYWPLRWLKVMARLPGNHDTWLGWGHTVPAGQPFADNTALNSILLLSPGDFPAEGHNCTLPDGEVVNFYQMVPLHQEEMDFKLEHGVEALLELMTEEALTVLDIQRENFCESY